MANLAQPAFYVVMSHISITYLFLTFSRRLQQTVLKMIKFCVSIFRPGTNTMFLILLVPNTIQSLTHWVCLVWIFFLSLELTLHCYCVAPSMTERSFCASSSNSHSPSPPSSSNAFSLVSSEQDHPSTSGCRFASSLYLSIIWSKMERVRPPVAILRRWKAVVAFLVWQHWRVLDCFVWCTCVLLMYAPAAANSRRRPRHRRSFPRP